jgi:hypothetical protein
VLLEAAAGLMCSPTCSHRHAVAHGRCLQAGNAPGHARRFLAADGAMAERFPAAYGLMTSLSPAAPPTLSPRVASRKEATIPELAGDDRPRHGRIRTKCRTCVPPLSLVSASGWVHVITPMELCSPLIEQRRARPGSERPAPR